ncbi:hypothetical protein CLIB1423_02S02256 [[Candida] railenensis]|uniref:DH domain-containing protein n=1 Tax=[Candida] railenensis TaxID=45579 RepID=A0A9P0QK80_9ASCO|nr:hypothetical protein CLIB1423_02S02256 [[Candida] railenensis]
MSSNPLKQSRRRNLELSIKGLHEKNQLFFKHASPLTDLSDLKAAPTPLHFAIIELLSTEMAYCEDLKSLVDVYSGLLFKSTEYENILMQREKELLFQNVLSLEIISDKFVKRLKEYLKSISSTTGSFEYDGGGLELVLGADLKRLNLGSLISRELCDNKEYRTQMNSFIVTQQFRLKFLEHEKRNGGVLFDRWLKESDLYCTRQDRNGDAISLQSLLSKPIQRFSKYPPLLKRILDEGDKIWTPIQKHELSVCLIKLSQMLHSCNQSIPVENWPDCDSLIFAEDEPYSFVDHGELLVEFKASTDMLGRLLEAIELLSRSILNFSNESYRYARAWNELCNSSMEDGCTLNGVAVQMCTPYESYCDKSTTQLRTAIKLVAQEFEDRIIKRLKMAVGMCKDVEIKINSRQKLSKSYMLYTSKKESNSSWRRSAQKYILLDNRLKDQLPKLKAYIEEFCIGIETETGKALLQWVEIYAGQSSSTRSRHVSEIVQQYRDTIKMSGMKFH